VRDVRLAWRCLSQLGDDAFFQWAEHRDTQALQAKLDELIRGTGAASYDGTETDDPGPEEARVGCSWGGRVNFGYVLPGAGGEAITNS
jgi:hypothetical protein